MYTLGWVISFGVPRDSLRCTSHPSGTAAAWRGVREERFAETRAEQELPLFKFRKALSTLTPDVTETRVRFVRSGSAGEATGYGSLWLPHDLKSTVEV